MNSVIGGMVALEVLKALSGKYAPIQQWFYFDAFECLNNNCDNSASDNCDCADLNSRYDKQIQVFGKNFQETLGNMKYFIVGSGAIGCELLKNFAMIGLATGPMGNIYITDMDTIEKSNLNRQFLFRNNDIGKAKSEIAAIATKKINPSINITAHTNRIGSETEHIYDINFFESLDGVANALDNIQTRLYVDKRCLLFKKPLLESGTMGTKASVQVIVPHLTESYGSSNDQQAETSIPICTIKSFPNAIEHTIQWAREQFEDFFVQKPKHAADYIINNKILDRLDSNDEQLNDKQLNDKQLNDEQLNDKQLNDEQLNDEQLEFAKNINFVLGNAPKTFDNCIITAYNHWHDVYNYQIEDLLKQHPIDSQTTEGALFWSGTKKCPKPLVFNTDDENHVGYIHSYARIWANIFCIEKKDIKYTRNVLTTVDASVTRKIYEENKEQHTKQQYIKQQYIKQHTKMNGPETRIVPENFEKDDDANYHIDFITYASNMRALNYDIGVADRHTTKGIVGKIIPALASTTSLVAGLVTLRIIQTCAKISKYRIV